MTILNISILFSKIPPHPKIKDFAFWGQDFFSQLCPNLIVETDCIGICFKSSEDKNNLLGSNILVLMEKCGNL